MSLPIIYRSLSSHHWYWAERVMLENKSIKERACTDYVIRPDIVAPLTWSYYVVRNNRKTMFAERLTYFGEKVVHSEPTILPKSQRCKAMKKNRKVCRLKTYTFDGLCHIHGETPRNIQELVRRDAVMFSTSPEPQTFSTLPQVFSTLR